MKKYTYDSICPKCGSSCLSVNYDGVFDRIDLKCGKCSYKWSELPMDYKEGNTVAGIFGMDNDKKKKVAKKK